MSGMVSLMAALAGKKEAVFHFSPDQHSRVDSLFPQVSNERVCCDEAAFGEGSSRGDDESPLATRLQVQQDAAALLAT